MQIKIFLSSLRLKGFASINETVILISPYLLSLIFFTVLLYFFTICSSPELGWAYQTLVKCDFRANINLLYT